MNFSAAQDFASLCQLLDSKEISWLSAGCKSIKGNNMQNNLKKQLKIACI